MTPEFLASQASAIKDIVDDIYPDDGPGAGLLILLDGEPCLLHCRGLARLDTHEPIRAGTVFDLASVGKHFTAYAVLLLASRDLLSADDPLSLHFPDLADLDQQAHRPVRIADLLHHHSGLPDYIQSLKSRQRARFTNDCLLDWAGKQRLLFAPGTCGLAEHCPDTYCNSNYGLLGCLVEQISGTSFPEFLHKEIFAPLGMARTFCTVEGDTHPFQAHRHGKSGERLTAAREIPVYGDGNIFSCLEDLASWDRELTHPTLMSAESLTRAFTHGCLDDGRPSKYAWGWWVGTWYGQRAACHGGSWDGTSTSYSRYLDERLSILLLSNSQIARAQDVSTAIESLLLG